MCVELVSRLISHPLLDGCLHGPSHLRPLLFHLPSHLGPVLLDLRSRCPHRVGEECELVPLHLQIAAELTHGLRRPFAEGCHGHCRVILSLHPLRGICCKLLQTAHAVAKDSPLAAATVASVPSTSRFEGVDGVPTTQD